MIMSLKMALRSIGSNKLRAVLTMLGIIIGVMALVVLVSLVNGATSSVTDRMASLGSNYVQAYVWGGYGQEGLKIEELDAWVESEPLIESVAPQSASSAMAKYASKSQTMTVVGTTPSYYDINGLQLTAGRFLKTADVLNNSRVCVLGPSAMDALVGHADCIGDELSLDGLRYTIVGVLGKSDSLMYSGYGENTIYIPFGALIRQFPDMSGSIDNFYATAPEGTPMKEAENAVRSYLKERVGVDDWGNENYYVYSMDIMEGTMDQMTSIFSMLLGGIASISLIVGGIGIMNIMLVTVTERTREIGIRKAVGATRGTILRQFLLEAVVLCMMGCAIGIFLSWCILRLATEVVRDMSMSFSLSGNVVWISVIFCFVIGIIFGLYPANKAAKMQPIDALHYGG
ncbi:MAG: ABC transporter permease [Oscillospiraceae bacterium]|nr:ABC transporter permease [Oscillospiraceae bacterium]